MDPMIKNSFFTILIYWNDNRIHLGLTKKLIFFILFPPLIEHRSRVTIVYLISNLGENTIYIWRLLNVPKITRFLGGPNRPKICVRGTKINFKD